MTYLEWLKQTPATYYACNDPEQLDHEDPDEAVLDYVEGWWDGEGSFQEFWEREGLGVTITAYERKVISAKEKERWAESAFADICEAASEEYGDPDGTWGPEWSECKAQFLACVGAMFEKHPPWACETSGSYELTSEEVLALVKEHRPDWLEAQP